MEFLTALWMPILVSSVVVWIVSAITHMALPFHKNDFSRLPDEEKVRGSLAGVPGGNYMFPYCTQQEMNSPEFKEKLKSGPSGTVMVSSGEINMGQNLLLTLLCYILIGIFVAYLGHHSIPGSAPYLEKFRFAGTVALAGHTLGWLPFAVWYRNIKVWPNVFDGVVYALVTAGIFGWLWH